MRWEGWEPKTQAAWGSQRDGAGRPASYVSLRGSSQAWRDGGQRMRTRLTFVVSGVRREADVHGPLDGTVEAVCVRAGVAERRAGRAVSTGQGVPCTHSLGHADRHTHIQTRTQPHTRAHSDTRMQTHTQTREHTQRRADTERSRHTSTHETRADKGTGRCGVSLLSPTVVLATSTPRPPRRCQASRLGPHPHLLLPWGSGRGLRDRLGVPSPTWASLFSCLKGPDGCSSRPESPRCLLSHLRRAVINAQTGWATAPGTQSALTP